MGGSKVKFPEMSAQERELQSLQMEILREQRTLMAEQLRVQDLLAPFLYESAGLKPIYDGGKIVGFEEINDPLEQQRKDVEASFLERTQKALKGELDVDPALERGIAENQRDVEATLAQQLGPGYATSTPGIQALAEASKGAEELRASARRGEMTLSEGLGLAREQSNRMRQQSELANLGGAFQVPGAGAGTSVPYLNSIAQALGGYGAQRQGQFQASMYNAQQPGFMDFLGQLLGIAGGSFLGGFGGYGGKSLGKSLFG